MNNPCKVLVVDDEPLLKSLIFQVFKTQINSKQLEFHFASNGVEALDLLKDDPEIGVILTDIKMPQMDGLALTQHLTTQDRFYKIMVITAYGDISNIRKAMENGASDFILKPFDIRDLEISVIRLVEQYQLGNQRIIAKDRMVKLSKEFEIARKIKKSFIPTDFSIFPKDKVLLYGEMISSHSLGGDFFDCFMCGPDSIALLVANVSGKGVPAALYTAIIQMIGRGVGLSCESPIQDTSDIYHFLFKEIPSQAIKGLFYGIFNLQNGKIHYCNTGEVIAYYISQNRQLTLLSENAKIDLKQNEKIFVSTKELLISKNKEGTAYGEERLTKDLIELSHQSPEALVKKIKENFLQFINRKEAEGDIPIPLFCLQSNL